MAFMLKKTLAPFLLPPGIFILILTGTGLVLAFKRRWWLSAMNLVIGILLWMLSTIPVATLLMRGLEADFPIPENPSGDVIIVLGGGIMPDAPDLSGNAAPTPLTMGRIVTAVRLYQRLKLPIIVSGGRLPADGHQQAEAPVIKRFLVDLGVPEMMIIEENQARDTMENAKFSATLCREKGFSKPILLTSAFHLKRSLLAFESTGMKVSAFPAYFLGAPATRYGWYYLIPRAQALYTATNALHEYLGILYYRLLP